MPTEPVTRGRTSTASKTRGRAALGFGPKRAEARKLPFVDVLVVAVLCGYAAFVLAWWLGRWIWGDQLWPLALLNSFPAWLFLPVPLTLLLAAISRQRLAWAAASVPVILWLTVFGWRFLPRAPIAESNSITARVMAFNLLADNGDLAGIVAAIRAAEPDLIALPELSLATDTRLAQQLGDRYPYRTRQSLQGVGFGTGIYSRWPVEPLGSLQTGLGLRSVAADIHTPRGVVRFVALHPNATYVRTHSMTDLAESIATVFRRREAQLAAVCGYLDRWGDRPVILAGDFNMTEFSDAYRCVAEKLTDAYRAVGWGYGYTWPNQTPSLPPWRYFDHWPLLTRIDYVFHSRHWVTMDAHVPSADTGSDHRPVVVTLRWTKAG
jgi:endonuclease/exonuclease/phosphatase (EEP) superfamily protein YafD